MTGNRLYPEGTSVHQFDDKSTVTAFNAGMERVAEQIKDAKARGVNPALGFEPGKIIPPPPGSPGYDKFAGKVCHGPGLVKPGFGKPKICGRQAVAVLRVFKPDMPEDSGIDLATVERRLAMDGYGGGYDASASDFYKGRMYADSVPKGGMVPDAFGTGADFVCHYHSMARYHSALHPEDGGIVPEAPKVTGDVVFGLDKLTPGRPFRCVSSDANYCWVSDGKVTVMCHRRDYVALLAEYGLLPEDSTVPLP